MLAGLLVLLLTPVTAPSQQAAAPFGQGTHALRGIIRSPKPIPGYARRFELQPIRDYGAIDADTVVIVLGDPTPLFHLNEESAGGLRRFVSNGGALLVASDRPVGEPLAAELGIEIAGGFYQAQGVPSYGGLRDCPLVSDLVEDHPVFRRVEALATNRPSALALHRNGPLQVFAWLPLRQNPRPRGGEPLRIQLGRLPFIAGGELGMGRVLVIADHSVFINDMMLQPDTDNFDYAYNCIDWLSGSGQRKKVMLIDEGQVVTNFNVSFKPPPLPKLPSQEQLVGQVNRILVDLEEENQFNGLLLGMLGGHDRALRLVLLLATAGLLFYGMLRLVGARLRQDRNVPLALEEDLPQAPPLASQRLEAMLNTGNCWEAARGLARHCLESAGCQRWDRRPDFRVAGTLFERFRLRRQLGRLWQLAAGRPRRVAPRKLLAIHRLSESVSQAVGTGKVRLVEADCAAAVSRT